MHFQFMHATYTVNSCAQLRHSSTPQHNVFITFDSDKCIDLTHYVARYVLYEVVHRMTAHIPRSIRTPSPISGRFLLCEARCQSLGSLRV